ncbi:SPOSA6832_04969 [Sporobolomyces salmonicolor]|uniref:SPOSA6832_04969-mRNA-1:cds n=1 Tax=Sporidiobolus salmonicolor TaxID=5005 RepID=A0A0D6ET92_SPOSA|nr:SPOSA6832_04969 [Sporobolomyces salmonicolor]
MPAPKPPQRVLVVGAGEFGSSAALALAEGPYSGRGDLITLLERGAEPPAIDAASSDINKLVLSADRAKRVLCVHLTRPFCSAADPLYAQLAKDAIKEWHTPRWKDHYHESGVVVVSRTDDPQANYVRGSYANNAAGPAPASGRLESGRDVEKLYPEGVPVGSFEGDFGCARRSVRDRNAHGGWAASRDAVVSTIALCRTLGVRVVAGEASNLLLTPSLKDVRGVRLTDGRTLEADFVIAACGSWTPMLLPELKENCLPTGQTIAMVQLSEEETRRYRDIPVSLCMDTGFYCFPPTSTGIVKMAIHDRGWLAPSPALNLPSAPRTSLTAGYEQQQIPASALAAIRDGMRRIHPELAEKEIIETRLCWYSDRVSGDFLFDYHPRYPSLFVAAGGSGHAFKFMPLVPAWILSALQGTLSPELKRLWSFEGDKTRLDTSRGEKMIVRKMLDGEKAAKL